MLRVKNFVPAISLEGSEEANADVVEKGVYQKVMHAMELLKAHKLSVWCIYLLYFCKCGQCKQRGIF